MALGIGDAETLPADYRMVVVSLTAKSHSKFCQTFEKSAPLALKQRSSVVNHLVTFPVVLNFLGQLELVLDSNGEGQQAALLHQV